MKKVYRIAAGILAVLGGFAAIGAGVMIVVTAIMVGGLMALAAKLALKGTAANAPETAEAEMEAGMEAGQAQA